MNYNKLSTLINAYIKRNGKQEITGPVLNGVLNAIVDSLAKTKQDKLDAGTGIAIQGNVISCTLDQSVFVVKQSLPEQPDSGKEDKIYVVPNPDGQGDDIYDEYAWLNGKWEKLGSFKASVDLSAYQTKRDDSLETEAKTVAGAINELHADKLDVNNYFSKIGSSAMRPVYEFRGAKWNSETGFYELNGLTDITEEQMLGIYCETGSFGTSGDGPICRYCRNSRTNLPSLTYGILFNEKAMYPFAEGVFEVINLIPAFAQDEQFDRYKVQLYNNIPFAPTCRSLKEVKGAILLLYSSSDKDFNICSSCESLREIRVMMNKGRRGGSFCKDSPLLSYESVKYLVENATVTTSITIIVHPATYSYLSGTAQPTAEVGGTTEEWQALMTTAASKQISFATEE